MMPDEDVVAVSPSSVYRVLKEADVATIIQRAREKFPGVHPRIISDNGPVFIARDFKHFIRICGMSHLRTTPFYPQSNVRPHSAIGYIAAVNNLYGRETLIFSERDRKLSEARELRRMSRQAVIA